MTTRGVLALTFVMSAASCFGALELHIAPIAVLEEPGAAAAAADNLRPGRDLAKSLSEAAISGALVVREVEDPPASPITSYLDAAKLCQSRGYGYLLYGYVKRSELALTAEVKLLDATTGTIAASFFNSDDSNHYARLMKDLAARIEDYFATSIGLNGPAQKPAPQRNILSMPVSLGYWTPAGGEWSRVLAGLGSFSLGARFIPARPLFKFLDVPWFVGLGIQAEYSLGLNQPGYESFLLHEARLRLPVELGAEVFAGHVIGFAAGPLLVVDTIVQDQLYASTRTSVTTIGGLAFAGYYRYSLSKSISMGLTMQVDIALYSTPLTTISPRFDVEISP